MATKTKAGAHEWLALGATTCKRELTSDVSDRFAQLGSNGEVAVVGDERATDQSHCASVGGACVGEFGAPAFGGERETAQAIDHDMQHLCRIDWAASRARSCA